MEEKVIEGKVNLTKVLLFFVIFGLSVILLLFLIGLPEIIEGCNHYHESRNEYYQELIEWRNGKRYWRPDEPYSMDYDTALGYALDGSITAGILIIFILVWLGKRHALRRVRIIFGWYTLSICTCPFRYVLKGKNSIKKPA